MLQNKPRGVPCGNDRRNLNGVFRVLRFGAPWRDPPEVKRSAGEIAEISSAVPKRAVKGTRYPETQMASLYI
jgi:hypothetical protein